MSVSETSSARLDPSAILNRLDWQLGEVGRRQHRFAWLRNPGTGDWAAVDAYYPGNRVVVLAGEHAALRKLCEDLVPRNGLYLLTISAAELIGNGSDVVKTLRARLEIQGWAPRSEVPDQRERPAPPPPPEPSPVPAPQRVMALAPDHEEFDVPADVRVHAPARSPGPSAGPRTGPARSSRRSTARTSQSEGIGVGITLVVAVVLELAVGGGVIGLGAGQYVLGFGIVLDACARVLGMIAASQSGDLDAAWTAVIFGSPALWGLKETSEPGDIAPVTRVTAVLAGGVVVLGLAIWIV
jgi:hypothetical protein